MLSFAVAADLDKCLPMLSVDANVLISLCGRRSSSLEPRTVPSQVVWPSRGGDPRAWPFTDRAWSFIVLLLSGSQVATDATPSIGRRRVACSFCAGAVFLARDVALRRSGCYFLSGIFREVFFQAFFQLGFPTFAPQLSRSLRDFLSGSSRRFSTWDSNLCTAQILNFFKNASQFW